MRLATAYLENRPQVFVECDAGLVSVEELAYRMNIPALRRMHDVGALLERGQGVMDVLATAVASLPLREVPTSTLDQLRVAPPVLRPSKIIAVGLNYVDHAAEGHAKVPSQPLLFAKLPNTLIGHMDPIIYPRISSELDYEGELAVIIGRRCQRASRESALDYVAGYSIANDVSARDLQTSEPQWVRGKSLDTFAPVGPYFVTADAIPDVSELRIQTRVNGQVRQDELCKRMVFDVPRIIEFISEAMTLEPGDLILSGTPAGTGNGYSPPRYLSEGDQVEVSITGLGTLISPIAAPG